VDPESTVPNPPGISNLTPVRRHIRASIAANTRWAQEDPTANAARGQAGLLAKFEREAREAEPGLTDAEYARRAESARKAHMARLAFASSKARGARKAGGDRAAT
jgi:hypothetical protein